ncbi:MAG: type VI secretion system protein TssA [Gemmataceae bacterium]
MAAALLDFETLLKPLPGDNPAGSAVPFDVKHKLEEFRKEENPSDYRADDPTRPQVWKKADWAGIVKLSLETLTNSSKDLLIAARLTEGLTREAGYPGFRDGLTLLRRLIEQCWDRIYPTIEDGDLEVRGGPFNWLDDAELGARFPSTLRTVPLLAVDGKTFSFLDWRQSQDGKGSVTREEFEKAIEAISLEQCETIGEAISQCRQELTKLRQLLAAKMGPVAPGLTSLGQVVDETHTLMQQILLRKRPVAETQSNNTAGKAAPGSAPKPAATRTEAYRLLGQAASLLRELEPHSPIPYLIQRAVELGSLPFPELIKELVRDQKILSELNRELGIKEAPAPAQKK